MTRRPTSRPTRRLAPIVLLPAVLLLGLSACSSSGSDDAASEAADAPAVGAPAGALDGGAGGDAGGTVSEDGLALEALDSAALSYSTSGGRRGSAVQAGAVDEESSAQQPAIISTGTVSLRADDVGDARFEVQKVVDRVGGQVTDSETRTFDDGSVRDARLVLRVPAGEFTETMDALEKVADLEASSTASEDVTTQVVDTAVRIRVQRESIARIEELLARAGSIRDVVSVERELTDREARLNSLLRQQAYLSDQSSMSTITVHLQRHPEDGGPAPEEDDEDGFVAGLTAGWDALSTVAVGLATAAGALLPFAAVGLVLGVPVWVLVRRRRTALPAYEPEPTA